jgi:hypothetical protein
VNESPTFLLPIEYRAALERVQHLEDRLLWISGGGGFVALAAAAYVIINRAKLEIGPAWIAPIPFIITAAVVLGLFSARLVAQARVKFLREHAGSPEGLPTASSYSPVLRGLMLLPGICLGMLFLPTVAYALRTIYSISRAAGTIFGVVYFLSAILLGVAAVAVWRQWRALPPLTTTEVFRVVLPDPINLLLGMGLFFSGFMAPLVTVGLNTDQLGVLNALFRRAVDFTDTVPLGALAALGFTYFLVLEGLLVPAGRMWQTQRRAAASPQSYTQIIIRLLLAFPLAFALGGIPLLVLSLLIWLHQAVSALDTHPDEALEAPTLQKRQVSHLRFNLLWDGLLAGLRFYGGVLVWVGSAWSFTIFLLMFCAVAFLGVAFGAAHRARRARLSALRGELPAEYDVKNAPRWQHAGFLAAGLTLLGLVMLQILAETNEFFNSYIAVGYGRFNNGAVLYSQAGLVNGLLVTVDLLVFGLFFCALYIRLLRPTGPSISLLVERTRAVSLPLLLAGSLALSITGILTSFLSLAFGGLLTATLAAAIWCER